jgi:hypothetical protein
MRILVASLLLLLCSLCRADEPDFTIRIKGSPEISVFVMGTPVENFDINSDGLFQWDTWKKRKPSKNRPTHQYTRAEYEKALGLVKAVFEKNYQPKFIGDPNKPYVVYNIKVGEYWNSLEFNLAIPEGEQRPPELQELLSFVQELRQPKISLKADSDPRPSLQH